MNKHLGYVIGAVVLLVSVVGLVLAQRWVAQSTPVQTATPELRPLVSTTTPSPATVPTITLKPSAAVAALPSTVNHNVPFTAQAPYGVWDHLHGEACEEASALMAYWYARGESGIASPGYTNRVEPAKADAALQAAVAWQNKTFGYFEDTTAEETARMLREHFGLKNVRLSTDVTEQSMQRELAAGNVLLLPAAGQLLGNPNFRAPGPPYHMLVVRGYNSTGFITNDPGTRNGEGYVYASTTLLNAVHDWTGDKSTITQGKKVMIVVGKE